MSRIIVGIAVVDVVVVALYGVERDILLCGYKNNTDDKKGSKTIRHCDRHKFTNTLRTYLFPHFNFQSCFMYLL